jgi:hypothetical protein
MRGELPGRGQSLLEALAGVLTVACGLHPRDVQQGGCAHRRAGTLGLLTGLG